MKVTTKGQVTIPLHIREKMGITASSEVDFVEEDGRVYLLKKKGAEKDENRFRRLRGIASVRMSTDEIMALTRRSQ